jgi:hypothetical protein
MFNEKNKRLKEDVDQIYIAVAGLIDSNSTIKDALNNHKLFLKNLLDFLDIKYTRKIDGSYSFEKNNKPADSPKSKNKKII